MQVEHTVNRNVFKDLEMLKNETRLYLLRDDVPDDTVYKMHFRKQLLDEIETFMYSFSWLRKSSIINRIDTYRNCHFDVSFTLKTLGETSPKAFNTAIWTASKKFKELIGENTLDLIKRGDDAIARRQFLIRVGSLNSTRLISDKVIELLPEPSLTAGLIYASECRNELQFLKSLTLKNIESVVNRLDDSKLAFLRYLLDTTDSSYAVQRELVYQFLEGEIDSIDNLVVLLKSNFG